MNEQTRQNLNNDRLEKVDPSIRDKVIAVLKDVEGAGEVPLIAEEVWRDPALQLEKFKEGKSKLKWGFHCFTRKGKPSALAVDIVDANKGWGASSAFWLKLASAGFAHGLNWGGLWGLPQSLRNSLKATIAAKHWTQPVKLGWDVAHLETSEFTVEEARKLAN